VSAPTRRGLLGGALAAAAWWSLRPRAAAALSPAVLPGGRPGPLPGRAARAPGEPPFRISLAEWSLHRALFAGQLGADDFPRVARHDFGLDAIEHVSAFLQAHVGDAARLAALRRRADDLGVRSLLIMIDGEGELADGDDARRAEAIANHHKWLDAAQALGCGALRVNAGGSSTGSPEDQAARAADSLRRLAEHGGHGLSVIVENHGGLSSDGAWLASVMRRADHPRVGTLPDFGNFRISATEEYDRYRGMAELLPFARGVSAKSYAFDAAGEETTIDFRRMLRLVLEAGYHGHVGIEYEGEAHSERDGIAATLALLRRLQAELA
jgi:L-ribulose-5-phosphate 3-epimerase